MDQRTTGDLTGCLVPVFAETLPLEVTTALTHLNAPWFLTRDEFTTWTERHLTVTSMCCGPEGGRFRISSGRRSRAGEGKRHTFRLDPHTGRPQMVVSGQNARDEVEAEHLLWSLTHPDEPNSCAARASAMDWVGDGTPHFKAGWRHETATRLIAVRTVLRAVQYLDAGLDLCEFEWWLSVGVAVDLLAVILSAENEGVADRDELEALVHNAIGHANSEDKPLTPATVRALLREPLPI